MEGDVVKTKRAPSAWALAVKAYGKGVPKKGTAEYDAVKALMAKGAVKPESKQEGPTIKIDAAPEPKKTARAAKAKTAKAVVVDVAKEKIAEAEKVLPIAEVPEKPKRKRAVKPKTEAAPESALPSKGANIVTGVEMPIAHIIPMMRVGATHAGIKLPFNLK